MRTNGVDRFLEFLRDGKWHGINETIRRTKVEEDKAKMLVSFLEEYGFIQYDKETERVRLDTLTQKFLEKLEETESAYHSEITA